jgi:glucose-6-phosphate 1-dehydrogenase
MASSRSDALVLFGVTGDLAHKMIFPALYAMVKRGTLTVPIIGVDFPKWNLDRLSGSAECRNHGREAKCAAVDPDQTNNALSRARTDNSRFSVDKDLHGCRLYGQKPVFLTLSLRPRIESMSDSAIMR